MVPTVHGAGKGLAGLIEYVTHDAEDRETAERVAWTAGVNLPIAASWDRERRGRPQGRRRHLDPRPEVEEPV